MYIVAIGWLWVAFMMAITETSLTAAVLTFLFYGLFPCTLVLYLLGTPARRRRARRASAGDDGKTPPAPGRPVAAPPASADGK